MFPPQKYSPGRVYPEAEQISIASMMSRLHGAEPCCSAHVCHRFSDGLHVPPVTLDCDSAQCVSISLSPPGLSSNPVTYFRSQRIRCILNDARAAGGFDRALLPHVHLSSNLGPFSGESSLPVRYAVYLHVNRGVFLILFRLRSCV